MTFKSENFSNEIDYHLTCVNHSNGNNMVQSSLPKAIREARVITGRNIETGIPLEDDDSKSKLGWWSGAVIYLTILDQIGTVYKLKNGNPRTTSTNSIKLALGYFAPELSIQEISEIVGLRNAFHHDFSLLNIDSSNRPPNQRIYNNYGLNQNDDGPVVYLPKTPWDGNLLSLNSDNQTIINLKTFGDLVETIYERLLQYNEINQLEIALQNGVDELIKRYFLAHK